jgi:aspartate 1-decarboxylase
MLVKVLRAKIHRATITESDVDYIGSITIDRQLLDETGLLPGECVMVADLENGARFETYIFEGEPGSGVICINGAAARLVNVGDKVIVMAYAYLDPADARELRPQVALVDGENKLVRKL